MKRLVHSTMRLVGVSIGLLAAASGAQAAIDITAGRTKNMRCSRGLCMPISKGASLNIHELAKRLAESDVKVVTANGALTIEVTAPLSWASGHRLILAAGYNIGVKAPVTVAGPGRLTIATGANGVGGSLRFRGRGKIDFWDPKARLVINGNAYKLSNDVVTLADRIADHPSAYFALARDYDARGDDFGAHTPIPTAFKGGHSSPAGGLAGQDRNAGTIRASYAIGAVSAVHDDASIIGGFIGRDSVAGDLASTYWDLDTSGIDDPSGGAGNISNDPGITGLSDVQLKSALPAGFDPAIWGRNPNINNGYPYLLANPPAN